MTQRVLTLLALALLATCTAACRRAPLPAASAPTAVGSPAATAIVAAPATGTPAPTVAPAVTRTGADYVLRLPREDAVPADWRMSPLPDFQTRSPQPGDTYRFACRDLPARSIGVATVGYRHLDGLPSVAIEYVVYPSAEEAAAALADMREAAESCGDFTIGAGDSASSARFAPLDFAAGEDGFAAALSTDNEATGPLLTHVVKVRRDHVIIGVSHSAAAGASPPDVDLTRGLIETALDNLRDGPRPSGPSVSAGQPLAIGRP